jgi:hypothetical protein
MTMQFGCLCSEDALVCCNVEEERISRMLVESGQGGWRREKIGGGGRYDTMTSDQQLSSTWSSWLQLQFGLSGQKLVLWHSQFHVAGSAWPFRGLLVKILLTYCRQRKMWRRCMSCLALDAPDSPMPEKHNVPMPQYPMPQGVSSSGHTHHQDTA